ncbi:MAG: Na/Pi cotransporter family protein [Bacilli bacterium]|nr:Na/Pi cotransporter family protein [Bacilli bacterium]
MDSLLKAIMYLLVGVSVLLVGMKFMSGGLKKIAGRGLRRFFRKTQNNPLLGMGIGVAVTAVIQSSDATASLVIGFINAGVMEISQGMAIILGGYIGTTITGILASFSSLPISVYLLSLAFIGTVMMFINNEKSKNFGEILCGLGLLFFGLAVMKDAFGNADIQSFVTTMFSAINFPVLLFIVGVLLTALAQSSSAVTGIVIAMVGGGAIPLSTALYITLGATLGTVATTLLSSLSGNVDGKRTAFIAIVLRAFTSVIALILLMVLQEPICNFLHLMAINGSDEFPVAMFTLLYNVIFMPLLLPLIKPMVRLSQRVIKDKDKTKYAAAIQFIDDKLLKSPDIALMQLRKEIVHMFELAHENYQLGLAKIIHYTTETSKDIIRIEGEVDYLNERITDFMIKLAPLVQSQGEAKIGAFFHVINDIERIGDHGFNFHEMADTMNAEELSYSPAAIEEIIALDKIVQEMFKVAREIFEKKDQSALTYLREQEEKTHQLKQAFYNHHYERVLKDECSQQMTPYISSLIVELERVADHLTNIGYSIVNPTGDLDPLLKPQKKRARRKAN